MRHCPFPRSPQRLPWRDAEMLRRYRCVERDARRRLIDRPAPDDGRRGLGIVYAVGDLRIAGETLSAWAWRRPHPHHHPAWLGADLFADDPLGAEPGATLAARFAAAQAFAEAANAFFEVGDVRFHARPLEVAAVEAGRPIGIYAGEDADLLTVDLMRGLSNAQIVDRLVEEVHRGDFGILSSMLCSPRHYVEVWHRLERLDAVRAMLDSSLPRLRLPGLPSLKRRVKAAADWYR